MEKYATKSRDFLKLRRQAEQLIRLQPKKERVVEDNDIIKLVHELEVYQTELEIQNEELRSMQVQLQAANKRYMDLYDLAPVGYLSVDRKGLVSQANLTVAAMLNISRAYLINSSFATRLSPESQSIYFAARDKAQETHQRQTCTLDLALAPNKRLCVQMEITADIDDSGQLSQWRIAVMDISQRVHAENALQEAHDTLENRVQDRTHELAKSNERLKESEIKRRLLSDKILANQEADKKRISRELHDSIGQCLSAIKFRIEDMMDQLPEGCSDKVVESCKDLIPITQQSIEEVRRITTDMRPPMLDELGLLTTIHWFSREFRKTYQNLTLETKIDISEEQIPESLKIIIYRVIQESMHNIAKHSKADKVELSLIGNGAALKLVIKDNGQGFNPAAILESGVTADGYGLQTMNERIELTNGKFTIQSSKGEGTMVKATWATPQTNE